MRYKINATKRLNEKVIQKTAIVQDPLRPNRLAVEVWALYFALSKGINVPKVLDYRRNSRGEEILLLERIEGKSLAQDRNRKNADYLRIVAMQMLRLEVPNFSYGWINSKLGFGSHKNWVSFLETYIQIHGTPLANARVLPFDFLLKIRASLKSVDLSLSTSFLVHRDLTPWNILIGKDKKVWILDWGRVILGDPIYDLALFGVRYGHGLFWRNLARGYGFDIRSKKYPFDLPERYLLYEIIVLMALNDYKYHLGHRIKPQQLLRLIEMV